ncbi:glyoxalase [Hwanghaeella grinnelliae]|uniref:Glyoxalase n=1 Tax=Hwanghaeella grinnelliae TaxID=2500179 RepID=A0A3S2Z8S1_9PROT|nr:VOC family protein [Hwanghaeella grinnelliae]RVU37973.1 glyoxalase [Hwanghaeella grinnelliae]
MKIESYYPVIGTEDVRSATDFYQSMFGFVSVFEADWYVHLAMPDQPGVNLAILDCRHESVPANGRTAARGVLLNFETDDVDKEYRRLCAAGAEILLPLRDEPWGQRHFIVQAPGGVMIDVIKIIEPSKEFQEQYLN